MELNLLFLGGTIFGVASVFGTIAMIGKYHAEHYVKKTIK